ncbi:aldo/keto reductase [Lactobacillus helveticus]|uniref:aldo/keto reductase n=1 Tax=Lactobacillus helveticus TaxID=1587 RepID=UPI0005D9C029|nr:aldo/keto reductase [Lactobacillus helveticus]AJY61663.1 aldo/keto reductase [Lactobacillus helveticus]
MKQIKMGPSTLSIPAMALGIMRMDQKSVTEAADAISAAYGEGINFIDSADIYGGGKSETIFGQALKQTKISRDKLFIQSKTGIVPGKRYDFSKKHILTAVDGILERMQIDYLDSLVLHRPDILMNLEEVAEAFDTLQAQGKVRFFGVSNFNVSEIELLKTAVTQPIMFDQLQFGLMHTGMLDSIVHNNMTDEKSVDHDGQTWNYLLRDKITLQCWSPFQYGMFEGTFINNPKFPQLNEELEKLAEHYQVGKNAIAASWILRCPGQIQILVGSMNPKHIADSAAGSDIQLTKQEWYDLYLAAGNDLP